MKLTEERSAASLPSYLVDTKDKAQKIIDQGGDWAPPNMEKSFKTLWHVSG
jgi:hypothetical protein